MSFNKMRFKIIGLILLMGIFIGFGGIVASDNRPPIGQAPPINDTTSPESIAASENEAPQKYTVTAGSVEAVNTSQLAEYGEVGTQAGERIEVTMSPTNVGDVENISWVAGVRPAIKSKSTTIPGSSDGESLGVQQAHQNGITGEGVKVGIIDDGFDTDNPAISSNIVDTKSFREIEGDPAHGTSVAETVVRTAPDSQLYVTTTSTGTDTEAAINYLSGQNVDIIVYSAGFPVIDDDEIEYIAGSSRDITERHERRQELSKLKQQYQTLAENFPNGAVYLIDDNFEYVRARGEALKQADLSPADIEGHTPHEVFPDELADETCKHFEQAFNGNTTVVEQEYRNKRYRIRVTPVDGNGNTTKTNTETETEIARVMAVAQDITQYVEDRRELHRQNKQLDEFASVVSHDLRNPLTVAKGNLELLREECNSDDQREQVDKIDSALTRMDELIESILTLARANEQIGSVESVNLAELSQNCWQNVETTDATIHLDITATQTVTVKADVNRLAQLLENLMRNAIEHARNQDDDDDDVDKNENVTITIGELTDGFYIADDGDGISESDRDDVFEAGYTTSKHGTGFGLSIVKQVVEAHGWEISITESADGGARFEVTNVEMSRSESTQLESNRMNSE